VTTVGKAVAPPNANAAVFVPAPHDTCRAVAKAQPEDHEDQL